jgi:RNA polymerase sigma factor (sigma-70 family)
MSVAESHAPRENECPITRAYRTEGALLLRIAEGKFRVPHEEAEALLHDVFASYLLHFANIQNGRAWLVGAMCNASRSYWRQRREHDEVDDTFSAPSDLASDTYFRRLMVRQAVSTLRDKCKETLRLHYWEGRSAIELAEVFGTTRRYAEKLIHKCLKYTRDIVAGLERNDASG